MNASAAGGDTDHVQGERVGSGAALSFNAVTGEHDQFRDARQQPRQVLHLGHEPRGLGVVSGHHRQDVVETQLEQARGSEETMEDMGSACRTGAVPITATTAAGRHSVGAGEAARDGLIVTQVEPLPSAGDPRQWGGPAAG
ncbi:hypothetical protein [Streptomyces sparsogenes]|uniref:hypothetical protein n=1 Tax=Streptomyces sparsogenes TaxID=67365 RepID=UPI00114D24A1|nr:hypothetical protein [Streptomyces sparsogenes]